MKAAIARGIWQWVENLAGSTDFIDMFSILKHKKGVGRLEKVKDGTFGIGSYLYIAL